MKITVCLLIFGIGELSASLSSSTQIEKFLERGSIENEEKTTSDQNKNVSSSGVPEVLIVGGVAAQPNEFPWLVNLRIGGSFCGGSLIDMDLVLTAAHCVVTQSGEPVSSKNIRVIAGDHNLAINEGTEQTLTASGVRVHANYSNLKNDIAMIRVSDKFTRTASVRSIALPSSSSSIGVKGVAVGWGTVSEGGEVSNILNKVQVPIVTDHTCTVQMTYPDGQFCAGEGGKDSCQGDSGGPLICTNVANDQICGIVSYGEGCGRFGRPGVYTNVFAYVSWIEENRYFSSSNIILGSKPFLVMSILTYILIVKLY